MNPFLERLVRLGEISPEEREALFAAMTPPIAIKRGTDIVCDGDEPPFSVALLSGMAFRYKALGDGRQQIICFQTPGDGIDLYGYAMKRLDHGVRALTDCTVSHIPHQALDILVARYPRLTLTLWRETLMDASIIREQMVRIGQRGAFERTANLLCEIAHRLDGTELQTPVGYRFPIGQATLARALGMSSVHMNRIIKRLRDEELAVLSRLTLVVLDRNGLEKAGAFDNRYLDPVRLRMSTDHSQEEDVAQAVRVDQARPQPTD